MENQLTIATELDGVPAAPVERSGVLERIPYLDGWRGLAILGVLLGHFVGMFGVASKLVNAARLGVELFFALSGMLMGRLLFVKRVPIPHFYRRRVSRIFPALYAFLLGAAVWLALSGKPLAPKAMLAVVLFYYNYYAAEWHRVLPAEYAQIWSLCIEEHAYVALSVIAIVSRRTNARASWIIAGCTLLSWLAAGLYSWFTDWDYYRIFWRTETRLSAVFVSAALVCWMHETGRRRLVRGWGWVLVCFAALLLQTARVPDLAKYTIGSALLSVAVTHLSEAPDVLRRLLAQRALVWIGVLSYSVYLWQQPFKELRGVLNGPACLAGAVLFAAISYYLLESPARRWLNARWS